MQKTVVAVIAAGNMGAAVGRRLVQGGCTVLTNLDGRSDASRKRAEDAGMEDTPFKEIGEKASWVLSILPPSDAYTFAQKFIQNSNVRDGLIFADCNAVNPETVKKIAKLFVGLEKPISFVDSGIIGGPPSEGYDPTFYTSADSPELLQRFSILSKYGLKICPLTGEGAGIGAASALKMSYAGITKGTTALYATMILAARRSSPATADALLHELNASQNQALQRIKTSVPGMLPKAYRWVGEMEEIAAFVGEGEGDIYKGIAELYRRIERSMEGDGDSVTILKEFVDKAKSM